MNSKWFIILLLTFSTCATPAEEIDSKIELEARSIKGELEPYHNRLKEPQPGDWLAERKEKGQTFDQYIEINPVRTSETRNKLYIQLLGDLSPEEQKVIEHTAAYLGLFYQMETRILPAIPLEVPEGSKRINEQEGSLQYHTKYILYDILKPNLPDSAAVYVAFTAEDLYPDQRWNFVFGQASVKDRVGVWSIHRYGDPSQSEEAFKRCLFRAMKVASHETGHMFSMRHCIAYECNMNGSNSLEESDRKPPYLCPHCLAKMKWNLNFDVSHRYNEIDSFFLRHDVSPYFEQYYGGISQHLDTISVIHRQ